MIGKDIKISMLSGGLPKIQVAMNGWEVPIKADYIKQQVVDGEIVNISNKKTIYGVMQPLKTEEVNLKPEGQRSWSWYQLHVKEIYKPLQVEQMVNIGGNDYKIMAVKNYEMYGYIEYHIVRGYDA